MTMTIPTSDIGEIFLRLANSLDNSVLPHIENHYGRLQVHAARELLLNLGTRIEFKSRDIEASESVLRETLASLEKLMGIAPNAGARDAAPGVDTLAQYIGLLYSDTLSDERREECLKLVWSMIRFEFDAEAERIRTGMFSK
ncbi:hypothetical protein [Burkholderia multivorans]|uniref:hypothetical protein n=1 Tax=Burkholderia multivorans TaxID=87883 RepID=UPI0019D14A4B|nr:hypothetical protein [Burkholderia multivorans]MBN6731257.1 hypothetical protein [Burkholderia multivorans]MBN6733473.1 hypothetical protein [Burkholderia multivorans]MBN7130389.1 hypothetical protein [Burkholderia multivorans]MBN8165071.1 hypothetical protein [Burkholderia multivorans]MBN8170860.1 hypothetical protein [Burkholderia multivorans]